jgi:hypothetical protein
MKKTIFKIVSAIVICLIFIFAFNTKIANVNDMITYDFDDETILELSILNKGDSINDKYTTYITINNDNTGSIEMWPYDEKMSSYPEISFKIDKNDIRELKDILNRYEIKEENSSNKFENNIKGDIALTIYANTISYRFSNNLDDENFNFIFKYIKDLVPEEVQKEYDKKVKSFLES